MSGWLCEPEDAAQESWMSDVYWVKANQRHGHETFFRHRDGVGKRYDSMAWIKHSDQLRQLFYGNSVVIEKEINGFAARYDSLDETQVQSAAYVIDGEAKTEHRTSVFIITWGPQSIFLVTPDGDPPISGEDIGLVVFDHRFAVRIANVPLAITAADLTTLINCGLLRLPCFYPRDKEKWRPVIYMGERMADKMPKRYHRDIMIRGIPLSENEPRVI